MRFDPPQVESKKLCKFFTPPRPSKEAGSFALSLLGVLTSNTIPFLEQ